MEAKLLTARTDLQKKNDELWGLQQNLLELNEATEPNEKKRQIDEDDDEHHEDQHRDKKKNLNLFSNTEIKQLNIIIQPNTILPYLLTSPHPSKFHF